MIGNKTRKQRSYGGDSESAMREYASINHLHNKNICNIIFQ
jgi:hypothetical protein